MKKTTWKNTYTHVNRHTWNENSMFDAIFYIVKNALCKQKKILCLTSNIHSLLCLSTITTKKALLRRRDFFAIFIIGERYNSEILFIHVIVDSFFPLNYLHKYIRFSHIARRRGNERISALAIPRQKLIFTLPFYYLILYVGS